MSSIPSLAAITNETTTSLEIGIDDAVDVVSVEVTDWQAVRKVKIRQDARLSLVFISVPFPERKMIGCPTGCVTGGWAGGCNAILPEPFWSHTHGSKTR